MVTFARRSEASLPALEALATAGAFAALGMDRRRALWAAGAVSQGRADRLAGIVTGEQAPRLPLMSEREAAGADLWATGVSPDGHPTRFVRELLTTRGVVPANGLSRIEHGTKVWVGGVVTHRQRPMTAGGTTFINLEDETGLINVICSKGCWLRYRRVAREAPALMVRGRLEKMDGVVNIVAERLELLPVGSGLTSRDFR
jgi:error-prone DNA polymerase